MEENMNIKLDNATTYKEIGDTKIKLQDYEGAIVEYSKAIELNPNYIDAYYKRKEAKSSIGDYIGGIEDLSKIIEINPNDDVAYHNRGFLKYDMNDYDGALQDYMKTLEIKPNNARAYINLGDTKRALGNFEDAIKCYSKAIEFDSNCFEAYAERGHAKMKIKKYVDAIIDISKAIELNPNEAILYKNRGAAKYLLGAYLEAREDYAKVLKFGADEEAFEMWNHMLIKMIGFNGIISESEKKASYTIKDIYEGKYFCLKFNETTVYKCYYNEAALGEVILNYCFEEGDKVQAEIKKVKENVVNVTFNKIEILKENKIIDSHKNFQTFWTYQNSDDFNTDLDAAKAGLDDFEVVTAEFLQSEVELMQITYQQGNYTCFFIIIPKGVNDYYYRIQLS